MFTSYLKTLVSDIQIFFKKLEGYWSEMRKDDEDSVKINFSDQSMRFLLDFMTTTTAIHSYSMMIYYNQISPHKKSSMKISNLVESEKFIDIIVNYI